MPEQAAALIASPRIVLMRHGKPSIDLTGSSQAQDLASLAAAYQSSEIIDTPPEPVYQLAQSIKTVLCSDLLRARQSAHALGIGDRVMVEPLFSEAQLPHFRQGRIRLPVAVWLIVLRLLWLAGFSRNGESYRAAKRRAGLAAERLIESAHAHGSVLLVGHGVMNYLIARALKSRGWHSRISPGKSYWAYGVFEPKS